MVWDIVVANILVSALLMIWSKQVAKVAFIRGHLIVPGTVLFVLMGAWLSTTAMGDWITCMTAGAVGFIMKRGGWPRPPIILGLILGPIMEDTFQLSIRIYQGYGWFYRNPIVLILLGLTVITILLAATGIIKAKRTKRLGLGEGSEKNPVLSFPLSAVLAVLFGWAVIHAQDWPGPDKRFPEVIGTIGALLAIAALIQDCKAFQSQRNENGGMIPVLKSAAQRTDLVQTSRFYGYMFSIIIVTLLVGQMVALPLFITVYLRRWGGYAWKVSVGYGFCGWIFLYFFYNKVMHIFWHPSVLFG
jgi:hypothetical protein